MGCRTWFVGFAANCCRGGSCGGCIVRLIVCRRTCIGETWTLHIGRRQDNGMSRVSQQSGRLARCVPALGLLYLVQRSSHDCIPLSWCLACSICVIRLRWPGACVTIPFCRLCGHSETTMLLCLGPQSAWLHKYICVHVIEARTDSGL